MGGAVLKAFLRRNNASLAFRPFGAKNNDFIHKVYLSRLFLSKKSAGNKGQEECI